MIHGPTKSKNPLLFCSYLERVDPRIVCTGSIYLMSCPYVSWDGLKHEKNQHYLSMTLQNSFSLCPTKYKYLLERTRKHHSYLYFFRRSSGNSFRSILYYHQ